ncbi:hypothetical protein [Dactylosporangium sp. CA-092794]|uniref:hypothetical protein n=1 Tax=Dactylosporangium sp. CA-092794 TaxID=3239929 RepID=UPI003D8B5981
MVPEDLRDFFVASAGVAGALIGLLFVAMSVSADRLAATEEAAPVHRIRAAAALTAFTDALTVSLFALIPGDDVAWATVAVGGTGIAFVVAALLSLARLRLLWSRRVRDALFLVGLLVAFAFQLVRGLQLGEHPQDSGIVDSIAVLVVVCFLLGVSRAWELIGGPSFGVRQEVTALLRKPDDETAQQSAN